MNRSISDLSRQQVGRKMDYLFKTKDDSVEIGCGECALVGGVNTTKELNDASFKMPKVMKDMAYKIVALSPGIKHTLVITGVYIGEDKLKLVTLDCPRGYVTRYDAFDPVIYPMSESKIRYLASVLKMVVAGRLIMEDTKKKLDDDDSDILLGKGRQADMVPCFTPNAVNNKKRRTSSCTN